MQENFRVMDDREMLELVLRRVAEDFRVQGYTISNALKQVADALQHISSDTGGVGELKKLRGEENKG